MSNDEPFSSDINEFASIIHANDDKNKKIDQIKQAQSQEQSDPGGFMECDDQLECPSSISEAVDDLGISPNQYNEVIDLSDQLVPQDKKDEVGKTFNQLYDDLNNKYGLNLKLSANDFGDTLRTLVDSKNRQAMQLYTSLSFGAFRSMLYQRYLEAIAALSTQILDPAYLSSKSISYSDKLDLMDRLFKFMQAVEQIYSTVNIENSDLKLEHLSDSDVERTSINDADTRALLNKLLSKKD